MNILGNSVKISGIANTFTDQWSEDIYKIMSYDNIKYMSNEFTSVFLANRNVIELFRANFRQMFSLERMF